MSERSSQLQSLGIDRDDESSQSGVSWVMVLTMMVIAFAVGAAVMWYLMRTETTNTPPIAEQKPEPSSSQQVALEPEPPAAVNAPPIVSGVVASGYVVARRQATISAEITGRIQDVLVEEGTKVEFGQIVAKLNDDRAHIQLDLLKAQLSATQARIRSLEAQLADSKRVLKRASVLAERKVGSQANLTASQTQVDNLLAQIDAARADLKAGEVQILSQEDLIERHIVRAPFAGVVIAKNAQVGEILSPASAGGGFTRTGVATLVDMDSIEIEVDVNEGQINRIRAGQRVEARLDAYPNWYIAARVEAIIPTADRSRATIRVRVAFDERDARILPDMAARVTFIE